MLGTAISTRSPFTISIALEPITEQKNSCIRVTLYLSMCADNSTDTKTDRKRNKKMSCFTCLVSHVMCHVFCVTCHVSHVTCRVSPVTCHLSLTPTAAATDPPPAKFPIMHSRLVSKDTITPKIMQNPKTIATAKTQKRVEVC